MHRRPYMYMGVAGSLAAFIVGFFLVQTSLAMGAASLPSVLHDQESQSLLAEPPEPIAKNPTPAQPSSQFGDLARLNLICATDLPGSEGLDIQAELERLDAWAARVRTETDRDIHNFFKNPAEFEHSEPYYRILMLVTVLQQDLGVRYNPDRVHTPDFTNSKDLFIHGLLQASPRRPSGPDAPEDPPPAPHHGGTCVSLPVLYVAVGRRLGYPLKLATTKEHVFARWDDGQHRFNIEATSMGLTTFPDDHYKEWPHNLTDSELASGSYLRSLGPKEELALFLAGRGYVLEDTGRHKEALEAYTKATQLDPVSIGHARSLARLTRRMGSQPDPVPANPAIPASPAIPVPRD